MQAGIPNTLQNHGDVVSDAGTKPDPSEMETNAARYINRHTHFHYMEATRAQNPVHFNAMLGDKALFRRRIYEHAASPWEGDNFTLMFDLVMVARNWVSQSMESLGKLAHTMALKLEASTAKISSAFGGTC